MELNENSQKNATSHEHHEKNDEKHSEILPILNHEIGLKKIANILLDGNIGVINSVDEIEAVGHRVVHGGSKFSKTAIVNKEVKDKYSNPANRARPRII